MTKPLSNNAIAVYKKLYLASVLNETDPSEAHRRVARFAASAEPDKISSQEIEKVFFQMMEKNQFRANTPTMLNAGLHPKPQTSACFVGDLQDDMYSILDFDRDAAIIYKSGSGIGGNYGMLRETNANLSTGGRSSGPFAFLRKSAMTAHAVKSGGSSRRAAHMSMMTDTHPDLLKFITIKADSDEFVILPNGQKTPLFSAMNLSVAASDALMRAIKTNGKWDLIGVVDGQVKDTLPAKWLFEQIYEAAWKNGDPGIWFIDRANADNTVPSLGRIITSNPCGEQNLLPRQACSLGSINAAAFVLDGVFNWPDFQVAVKAATRFLDNCIDLSGYPTPEYERMALETRPIGLGIMGFADALILMGLKYDSNEARIFAESLAKVLTSASIAESAILARQKGAFPLFDENRTAVLDVVSKFIHEDEVLEQIGKFGVRNSHWTTIAPTGTTSLSCDCSQGMEPLFAICYDKTLSDSREVWTFVNPIFEQKFSKYPWYPETIKKIAENHGSIAGLDLPEEAGVFVTAHDIHWKDRIDMQAALQKGISNAISSTINLPNSAAPSDIAQIYMYAWEKGLKGITVYRDGCKDDQPVSFGSKSKPTEPERSKPVDRPKIRSGFTHEVKTGHGKVYLTVNCDDQGRPMEIFTNGGKNGSVNAANLEAMARLVSIALQEGVEPERLARTIENINDGTIAWDKLIETDEKTVPIISVPDAIGKVLRQFYCSTGSCPETSPEPVPEPVNPTRRCETCNSPTYMHDGCEFCPNCGSKCG